MKSFTGLNGTIILRNSGVAIIRENMLGTVFHNCSEVEIPYFNISKVKVIPGSLLNGFICIVENGHCGPSNIFSALKDKNTVIFRLTKNKQAENLKQLIETKL